MTDALDRSMARVRAADAIALRIFQAAEREHYTNKRRWEVAYRIAVGLELAGIVERLEALEKVLVCPDCSHPRAGHFASDGSCQFCHRQCPSMRLREGSHA